MSGHASTDQINNFFAAQCLVDDVIALHLSSAISSPLSFLIIGNFHTAYQDGVLARLQKRDPKTTRALVHLELKSDYPTTKDQLDYINSARYGTISDWVIFAE